MLVRSAREIGLSPPPSAPSSPPPAAFTPSAPYVPLLPPLPRIYNAAGPLRRGFSRRFLPRFPPSILFSLRFIPFNDETPRYVGKNILDSYARVNLRGRALT